MIDSVITMPSVGQVKRRNDPIGKNESRSQSRAVITIRISAPRDRKQFKCDDLPSKENQ
jgi:hypothetical protein